MVLPRICLKMSWHCSIDTSFSFPFFHIFWFFQYIIAKWNYKKDLPMLKPTSLLVKNTRNWSWMLCLVVVIALKPSFMHAFYVQWVCWVFWEEGCRQVMFLPNVLYCANVLVLMLKLLIFFFFQIFLSILSTSLQIFPQSLHHNLNWKHYKLSTNGCLGVAIVA